MESRVMQTKMRHDKGQNCCQAVACTYCDLFGMDEATAFKACEAFGAGMGGMNGTCGAVSGAVMAAGFKNSTGNFDGPKSKLDTYKLSKQILESFEEKNGSVTCRELKGVDTGTVLRSCPGCIEDAVDLVSEVLGL